MIIIHQCYCSYRSSLPAVNSNKHDTAEHFLNVADTVWRFQTCVSQAQRDLTNQRQDQIHMSKLEDM